MSPLRGLLTMALVASTVFIPQNAYAAGPSVELPATKSTPVTAQATQSRPVDPATANALTGDQPVGAASKDGGGTSSATSLAPSSSWHVASHTGTFSWSYPLRVPPVPGDLTPKLALSYSSSTVDGRTSATNNQASWVGDGWDLSSGFVERTYLPCAGDEDGGTVPPKTGDLCWRNDNATLALPGHGGQLVQAADGTWRSTSDQGARIERLPNADNGAQGGEHWKLTTVDGTQYLFGSRKAAASTWTVPVFGDDAGEPCHGSTFATSHCTQAWRWNLDEVIDRHGNRIVYNYRTENNSYGRNLADTAVSYVRDGTLDSIEYGMRGDGTPSARVEFALADRCVPGSTCTPDRRENWPDVDWSDKCDTATCKDRYSPSFWTSKRLAKVTTKIWNGTGYQAVDSWELDHQFPDPGYGEKASLWLRSIVHKGHVGGTLELPAITFEGKPMANRVYVSSDGLAPLSRYRVTGIVSESGGALNIEYAEPECLAGSNMPANPETNTMRCYPVKWTKKDYAERTDYFHKHVVARVIQSDRFGGMSDEITRYEYLDGAAWHYSTSEFSKPADKTWNEFRGFGRIRIHTGRTDDASGPAGLVEERYYRGMHGDKLPGNQTRTVNVTDSADGSREDSDWLAGGVFEQSTYDGATVVEKTISAPAVHGPLASRGELKSYLVREGVQARHVLLESGQWRVTRTESTYDDRGVLVTTSDLGDTAAAADDRCTTHSYARNTEKWLLSFAYRTLTTAVACGQTGEVLSDVRVYFDGQPLEIAPTIGDATRTESLREHGYVTTGTATYDDHGRVTESADALGRAYKTAYTPMTGGPLTKTVETDPLGFTRTTTFATAWGQPIMTIDPNQRRTEMSYDALGRTTEVWLPSRKRINGGGNIKFAYLIRQDGPSVVTAQRIGPKGNYVTTKTLHDGLLRPRQEQAPAPNGGRLLTDTRYDSHGRVHRTTQPYYANSTVDDSLGLASDADIPAQTRTYYDGAGRKVAEAFVAAGVEKWRTVIAYGGDRTHVTPPSGSTATTTIRNARGQQTAYRQYHAGQPAGAFDETTYAYTKAGQLERITDAAGNAWGYQYDLAGRLVRSDDVDKGAATLSYDDAGQLLSFTDARGTTLSYTYDKLGRRTSMTTGASTLLAKWEYDGAAAGKRLPWKSTRYEAGAAYEKKVVSYNPLNQPLEMTITIPEREGNLAGSYTTGTLYASDGTQTNTYLPATGDLPYEPILHTYDDLGLAATTNGGWGGQTFKYINNTIHTRYAEVARLEYGEGTKRAWLSNYYEDDTRRLKRSIVDAEVPAPMQTDVNYTYNAAGLITSKVDRPAGQIADVQCFRYDHLQRLTEAWTPGTDCSSDVLGGPAPYQETYGLDKAGNRTSITRDGVTSTYSYPAPGQPQAHAVTKVTTGSRVDEYSYDATGNTIARPGQTLEWTADGQLASVTGAGVTVSYLDDADGERLIRRSPDGSTLYLPGQELRSSSTSTVVKTTRYYVHNGQTVAVRADGVLSWIAQDHQGTGEVAINSSDLTVSKRRQTPFGAPRSTATLPGDKGFVGGTVDGTAGLVHIGARSYDPQLGKFISVDPIMGNEPQLLNAYSYSNNSPVTFSDPTGLYCDGCDYQDHVRQQNNARICDSCEYYDHTRGESSVWSQDNKRSSFCDSCEYNARKDNTKSAWNTPPPRNKAHQPSVFDHSEHLNLRNTVLAQQEEERKRKQEEIERCGTSGMWCKLQSMTDSPIWKWAAVGLAVVGLFACTICMVAGILATSMSLIGTTVSCIDAKWTDCIIGALSLGVGTLGGSFVKSAASGREEGKKVLPAIKHGMGTLLKADSILLDAASAGGGFTPQPHRRGIRD